MKKKQSQTGKKKHSLIQSVDGEDPCRAVEKIGWYVLKPYEGECSCSQKEHSELLVAEKT
jgi:hypothetical protein